MKILHIINAEPTEVTKKIIEQHSKKHDVKVINLKKKGISYEDVIDDIFSCDKVFSW
jgi:hypothetical protein